MPIDVVMPQMGESIFEGTITKWLKKTGDAVLKDEPLFEISTDKVDAEIPSPVAGILAEIKAPEGSTVEVNTVVAVVAESAAEAAEPTAGPQSSGKPAAPRATAPAPPAGKQESRVVESAGRPSSESAPLASRTEVVMPQMGESIFEGTITRWLKKTGDQVRRDEPLFEISTDKVDAEITAPVSGVLTEIKVPEGATVQINTVVAVIGGEASVAQPDGSPRQQAPAVASPATEARAAAPPSPASLPSPAAPAEPGPSEDREHIRSSPLVRRMARENNLDLRRITGSGSDGRITKEDVLRYMAQGGAAQGGAAPAEAAQPSPAVPTPAVVPGAPSTVTPAAVLTSPQGLSKTPPAPEVPPQVGPQGLVPMSRMRSIIAQRMVESRHTSPHAYSVYKIDMTRIVRLREREKASFEQRNSVKLTYMPFIAAAVVKALGKFPILNASLENNAIRYHQNVNLGIAVALEWGLIVPVVTRAEELSFIGLARAIADLAERARTKKLKPEEASGSTFTLTNSGVFGGEYGTPIINQPEAAILAIGGLRKEPAVLTDAEGNDTLAIRSMQHLCIGFDHRLVDGADAGKFMLEVQKILENWDRPIG
jgi:2-oxoglutarate dehydrogenase E2 component (dihydrolipoamide succinyltransferase)